MAYDEIESCEEYLKSYGEYGAAVIAFTKAYRKRIETYAAYKKARARLDAAAAEYVRVRAEYALTQTSALDDHVEAVDEYMEAEK